MELSQPTKDLIEKYKLWKMSLAPKEGLAVLHVDEVASKVASFYEQIRTIIDWQEEHLMRRVAIARKIKIRFFDASLNGELPEDTARAIVLDLIRGGYFPNDKIEESKVIEVKKIIDKYAFILKNVSHEKKKESVKSFQGYLLEIASCEVEEALSPAIKEIALIDYMFLKMKERIKVSEEIYQKGLLTEQEKDIQIYIACQQSLFKLDEPMIRYDLLKYYYRNWNNLSLPELERVSENIHFSLKKIEGQLKHPLGKKFYAICEKYDTPYLLLGDVLSQNGLDEISEDLKEPEKLESGIRQAYFERLKNLKKKIRRAAIYSTASIFITKILTLVILETIFAKIVTGHINFIYLAADVLIPTALMAFLVLTIRTPSEKNVGLATAEAVKIIYKREKIDEYPIKLSPQRSFLTRVALSLIYLAGAVVSFGLIYWVLNYFDFPPSSIIINIIFISLILFTGNIIRKRAKELIIEERSGGVLEFISDILVLPVAGLGQWLLAKLKKYNIVVLFVNILIDMPFSAFVEFLERWRYFIKERKEDLR